MLLMENRKWYAGIKVIMKIYMQFNDKIGGAVKG